jgi:polysaccharide export outer membrane protein
MNIKYKLLNVLLAGFCAIAMSVSAQSPEETSSNISDDLESDSKNLDSQESGNLGSYALKVGDTIRIQVHGEEELTMDVQLNNYGSFNYPYLGELRVLGMTLDSVKEIISEGLMDGYLVNPRVSVSMDIFREIFVGGEVNRSGNFPYSPGLTVGKAIVLAGGFTERASKKRIKVISADNNERKEIRVGLDYILKPGDEVNVSRRFF